MESNTLASRIFAIEHSNDPEKEKRIREEFSKASENNSLVQRVVSGTTTFVDEYKALFGKYDGADVLVPKTNPNPDDPRYRSFYECAGSMSPFTPPIFSNPVAGVIGAAGVTSAVALVEYASDKNLPRRGFLETFGFGAILSLFGGGSCGSVASALNSVTLNEFERNAGYLQQTFNKYYAKG